MLRQLGTKVNKAMAFYVKELLLTVAMTRFKRPDLIDQIWMIGAGMDVKPVKAPHDRRCFFQM